MPTEHFASKEAYRKWTAYRHIHGIAAPDLKTAVIAGKPHEVKHTPITTHAQATATRKAEKEAGMPQGNHHASVAASRRKK